MSTDRYSFRAKDMFGILRGHSSEMTTTDSPQLMTSHLASVQSYDRTPLPIYNLVSKLRLLQCLCNYMLLQLTTGMLQHPLPISPTHPTLPCQVLAALACAQPSHLAIQEKLKALCGVCETFLINRTPTGLR